MLFEDHSCDLKEKMSRMSKEVEDDDQKIDILSDCQEVNNACPLPLVIPLLFFMKSFLTLRGKLQPTPRKAATGKKKGYYC